MPNPADIGYDASVSIAPEENTTPSRRMRRFAIRVAIPVLLLAALFAYADRWWPWRTPKAEPFILPGLPADAPLPAGADQLLVIIADGANHPDLRCRAAAELLKQHTDEARHSLIRPIRFSSVATANRLAALLSSEPAGAATLLDSVERRLLTPRLLLDTAVQQNILRADPAAEPRIRALTQNVKPLDPVLQRVIELRQKTFDPRSVRLATGQGIFLGNCSICHSIAGQGAAVGPKLDSIGHRGLDRLVEDILDPSRYVDPAYRATRVDLKDGTTLSGLVKARTEKTITLVNFAGCDTPIDLAEIESSRPSDLSPMPYGFEQNLSPEDFNHLLAFLLTCRAPQ